MRQRGRPFEKMSISTNNQDPLAEDPPLRQRGRPFEKMSILDAELTGRSLSSQPALLHAPSWLSDIS